MNESNDDWGVFNLSQEIYTIGFGEKSLRRFVELLTGAGVTTLVDARPNNTSQLAGFAKKDDLAYIMELVGIKYIHDLSLAPTKELMDGVKEKKISWDTFKEQYLNLLTKRDINSRASEFIEYGKPCFLCSEHKPERCHRSLLVDYLKEHCKTDIEIKHLY